MDAQPKVRLTVQLNQNGIIAPLQRILRESFNNVALGLHAVEQYETDVLPNLPTSFFQFKIGDQEERLTEEQLEALKQSYQTWMFTTAFGEFIKAVFAALREAYLYCEVVMNWPGSFKSLDEIKSHIDSIRTKAQQFHLPTLMDRVSERLQSPLDFREHVLSINKVRNCLEHRHGVVTKKDINDPPNNSLKMKWRRSKVFYEKDGREIEVSSGSMIEGPATVMHKLEDASKVFKLGERISLSVDEFNQVMFTCNVLGQDIVSKLPTLPPESAKS
ncbi:MAG: hypothetical protein HYS09_08810 [Chloroflexi bacterium]|nr:hypothetical protein [Chloroflexota bacterium]